MRLGRLYDYYGCLLTEKQQSFMELYFLDDLSLGEIADEYGISRQAVHDLLKRVGEALENYEHRLGLLEQSAQRRKALAQASALLEQKDPGNDVTPRLREILEELGKDIK